MTSGNTAKRRSNAENLTLYRCAASHTFFYPHTRCPLCRSELAEVSREPNATLVSYTTVRVSPTGSAFRLGLAETPDGAKTLCILAEDADVGGGDNVTIVKCDGLYHARPESPCESDTRD